MESNKFGFIFHIFDMLLAPFTRRVKHIADTQAQLKILFEQGQVVFVGRAASFIEFLVVRRTLKKFGLPQPDFCNGINPYLWLPFGQATKIFFSRLFRDSDAVGQEEVNQLLETVAQGRHGMIFLKVRRGIVRDLDYHYSGFFGQVATSGDSRMAPTFLVPTSVFLTRRRKNTQRTLWDIFFRTYDVPGRFRTLVQLIASGSKGITLFSKEIDVRSETERARARNTGEVALEKRFRWTLLFHLNNEDRAYRGPTKRSRERKVRRILKEQRLRLDLAKVAERQNRSFDSVLKEADKTLHEITSDTSERMVNFLRMFFDFVWARTLEGIDFKPSDYNRMRELSKQGPVVFLPCHRSHVDYLVFAYMFEKQGMNYPRFAAGDNLSKWPLGMIFRRAGAFFVRRTFKGEAIFPIVFDAYIRYLLRDRHVVAFFMEGGRSRTGKLLHPKVGLLSMIMDAWLKDVVDDVPLVPVTIDYGRIFEGKAYLKEMGGQEKQKENLNALLRTRKFLRKKHGIIRMRFGEPIYLSEHLKKAGLKKEEVGFRNKLPLLHDLGFQVMNDVNRMVTITAANVLAGILMGNPHRGMTLDEIRTLFVMSVRYLTRRDVELAFPEKNLEIALDNAIQTFKQWETVVLVEVGGETVINIPPNKRAEMEYYKNNGLHFMLDLVLVATAHKCIMHPSRSDIFHLCKDMYELLQLEFIMAPDYPSVDAIDGAIDSLIDMGALKQDGDELRRGDDENGRLAFEVCGRLLVNFLESYFAVVEYLISALKSDSMSSKDALKNMLIRAELLYAVGTIQNRESINRVTFDQAMQRFNKKSWIQLRTPKGQKHPMVSLNKEKLPEFNQLRETLLAWMRSVY